MTTQTALDRAHAAATQNLGAVTEQTAIGLYLVYAAIAIGLVMYLARTLRRNGKVFLTNVFDSDELASSVNHLLVVGFYLLNLGFAFSLYQLQASYVSLTEAFNELVGRTAWLLLSLGIIHLLNMLVFWRIRTHSERARKAYVPPPPAPFTPVGAMPQANQPGGRPMPPGAAPA